MSVFQERAFQQIFVAVCFLTGSLFLGVRASNAQGQDASIHSTVPREEKFLASDGLVGSWMGCLRMPDERPEHGCNRLEYSKEARNAQDFSLYDPDGTLWWSASRIQSDDYRDRGKEYFEAKPKEGFKPFFSNGRDIVLRLVSESPNWLEVEINESTRKTKFISKTDPAWYEARWEFWLKLNYEMLLYPDQRLRDAPNGKLIDTSSAAVIDSVNFLQLNGEWAYVEDRDKMGGTGLRGWVRWRNGREILVRCFLNRLHPTGTEKSDCARRY